MSIDRFRETHAELKSWTTNNLLPEITQESIRRLLDDAFEDMGDLDREILDAQIRLRNLRQHLADLEDRKIKDTARICTLRGAISSLKKIPPEVLIEIFTYLSTDKVILPPTKKSHPWNLIHVCAHWRNIVWTSPAFSGSIRIENANPLGRIWARAGVISMWNSMVHAAFDYVLSVTRSLLSLDASSDGAAAVFNLVLSHSHRFQSLVLVLNQDAFDSFMYLPQHSLTHLEHLNIRLYGHNTSYNEVSSSLETLPSLRRVSFTSTIGRQDFLSLLLPWEQLTEIAVTYMDIPPTAIHTALQHCLALRKCKFTIGADAVPFSNTLVLTLPSLEILNLICHTTVGWDTFLQPFITPSLKDITLTVPQITVHTLISLIIRSKCSIEAVRLNLYTHHLAPAESDYEYFLQHLPAVTTFETVWITPASTIKKIHCTLLPILETSVWNVRPDGLEAFLDFIDAVAIQDSTDLRCRKIKMTIVCYGGLGFTQMEKRYQQSYEQYLSYDWLDLEVQNWETGYDMGFLGDSDSEEDAADNERG